MKRKKQQQPSSEFTDRERREYLYHTAEEMRSINDAADKRLGNDVEREERTGHSSRTIGADGLDERI